MNTSRSSKPPALLAAATSDGIFHWWSACMPSGSEGLDGEISTHRQRDDLRREGARQQVGSGHGKRTAIARAGHGGEWAADMEIAQQSPGRSGVTSFPPGGTHGVICTQPNGP